VTPVSTVESTLTASEFRFRQFIIELDALVITTKYADFERKITGIFFSTYHKYLSIKFSNFQYNSASYNTLNAY